MPLREYQCDACGHRFEIIQKMSDPPIGTCPTCGSAVHKLQSAPAFHLKGTGWYVTDYAKKDSSTAKQSDSDSTKAEKPATEKSEKGEKSEKPTDTAKSSATTENTSSTATTPKTQ